MDTRLNYQFVEVTDSISGEVWAGLTHSEKDIIDTAFANYLAASV